MALGLVLAAGLGGAGCLCPPRAEDLVATGFRTPLQTLTSYQTFLRADLPAQEYLCFSYGFRERNQLSATTYGEGRERLFRQQPWLKYIAKAKVVGELGVGEAEHWFDVRVLGRTVRVKLVREEFYRIFARGEFAIDGDADLSRDVKVTAQPGGSRVSAALSVDLTPAELEGLSELVVARDWKIDGFQELGDGDEPLPSGDPAPQP